MSKLYKFYHRVGQSGGLSGLFIADKKEVDAAIGKKVYFGDKFFPMNSPNIVLKKEDFKEIDVAYSTVSDLKFELGKTLEGVNPLHYICETCQKCGDSFNCDNDIHFLDESTGDYFCYMCVKPWQEDKYKKFD